MKTKISVSFRWWMFSFCLLFTLLFCGSMTVKAADTHTVRFVVDKTVLSTQTVEDGASVTLPSTPTKDNEIFCSWHISYDTEEFDRYGYISAGNYEDDATDVLNPDTFRVTSDVDFYANFAEQNKNIAYISDTGVPEAVREYMSENSIECKEWYPSDALDTLISVGGRTYCKVDLRNHGLPESCAGYTLTGFTFGSVFKKASIYQYDADTNTFTKEYSKNERMSLDDLSDNLYVSLESYRIVHPKYVKDQCLVTVNDSYYESDGTTLVKTDNRVNETQVGGIEYNYSALSATGYEVIGYSIGTSSYVFEFDNRSGTLLDDLTITFKYKKLDTTASGGRIEIPVEIEADGETKTDFVADNTILGGDLLVSIPAEMILAYDATNEVMAKEDYVSAKGRCLSTSDLEIKTLTSILYKNAADASITVNGTVTFGETKETYQVNKWSAAELLTGVKTPEDVVKKNIKASVLKSDIDFVGTYATSILYNISVLETT